MGKKEMKKILTIAGSDCSGGAGIQADIKTITVHKMYAMSVITALTAQNTTGVYGIRETDAEFVGKQMDCVFTDIRPDAVKIGMIPNEKIIRVIAEKLRAYQAQDVVLDPVMISTSGSRLMSEDASEALKEELFPLAAVVTPNLMEAEALCGFSVSTLREMERAAEIIAQYGSGAVLLKGGHLAEGADDLLYEKGKCIWFSSKRLENPNTHGTGCTLSSAIACNLAAGYTLEKGIKNAKNYLTGALQDGMDLGEGSGPLNHMYRLPPFANSYPFR